VDLKSHQQDNVIILNLTGRFDSRMAPSVRDWIDRTLANTGNQQVINLTEVSFMDSTALSVLVTGMKRCREGKGDLVICGTPPQLQVIFQVTRLDRIFRMCANEADAVNAFTQSEQH
jgi:anti-sigma B factor antagonist